MTTGIKAALTVTSDFEYDVAISFASEQRSEAEAVATSLIDAGVKVFYDKYEQADLWGKDLYDHLAEVYERKARFCLMLVSSAYANKVWTTHERRNAQARAISQKSEYILPVRFDDTEIPGLPRTLGYLRFEDHGAAGVSLLLQRKLGLPESMVSRTRSLTPNNSTDLGKFWEQRRKVPDTELQKQIWPRARWCIWICPLEFRQARFQTLDHCRQFMRSAPVQIRSWSPYPCVLPCAIETGEEWIAGETELPERMERWVLFRSGQFVYNRTFNKIPQLTTRVHALEIVDTMTATLELAGKLAQQQVLAPVALLKIQLYGVDGRALTWPQDIFGYSDLVPRGCWCQYETVNVETILTQGFESRRREIARELTLEIFSQFGWQDPPRHLFCDEQ